MKRFLLSLACVIGLAQPATAAITLGTPVVGSPVVSATSETVAIACDNATDVLFVGAGAQSGGTATSTATYNGVAMTEIFDVADTLTISFISAYTIPCSDTSSHNVVVTWAATVDIGQVWAVAVHGADQTTPTRTPVTDSQESATASVTVANAQSGDYVFDVLNVLSEDLTIGGGQTSIVTCVACGGSGASFGGSYKAASGSTSMSWTTAASSFWVLGAVAFIPAGGGEEPPPSGVKRLLTMGIGW